MNIIHKGYGNLTKFDKIDIAYYQKKKVVRPFYDLQLTFFEYVGKGTIFVIVFLNYF